ncbi:hypothetical protein JXH92_003664 [Salmonella enterica subsp. enterica serovar 4,[5],12:b:-]|nr:hypothetical protein [Salmonella enterica subsp. enterica serovar 4,[5],12:b:-]
MEHITKGFIIPSLIALIMAGCSSPDYQGRALALEVCNNGYKASHAEIEASLATNHGIIRCLDVSNKSSH